MSARPLRAPWSWAARTGWVVMALLGLVVVAFAVLTLAMRGANSEVAAAMFARAPWTTILHIACGIVTLVFGPLQFVPSIRDRHRWLHREIGMAYVAAVVLGGTAGLLSAPHSYGGLGTHLAFAELALGWIGTTVMAIVAIRRRDILAHQQWMVRSYALTLGAVTLRIWMPLSVMAGVPFEVAYPVVAWLAWVPNVVVAELWVVPREAGA
ncbi:MAG TPA: DUF2306 domain-containing protein [Gemmatimonadales bacterium]|nr:DUF2306 domain-containing protein [Gemmatimonadales bacterium]